VRDSLGHAQQVLQLATGADARMVKWVAPASIHLTLKFLGDTPTSGLDAIRAALQRVAAPTPPFSLHLGHAGCFPNARQPRVVWIGMDGDLDELSALQKAIEATVSPLGFPAENRPFSPHLTLGRVRDDTDAIARQRIGAAVQSLPVPALPFSATGVSLMRSELQPGGAVYTQLAHQSFSSTIA
jgi:RNA 2',3'-cyclic 3'-phosphodiesterase